VPEPTALQAWADSGAMALTGRADGPPLASPGNPALVVGRALDTLASAGQERTGLPSDLPGAEILGERAALAGLARNGPWSCGGAFRAVRTLDGWLGLSLARPTDLDVLPALVERPVPDPWAAVTQWAATRDTDTAVQRARLLDLPCSAVPNAVEVQRPAVTRRRGGARDQRERPLVVDLTSLWAGPLCAHLLGLTGCEVIKVESSRRLDGARRGAPEFFDLLHAGHASVTLDFADPDDLRQLRKLLARCDLVLEASRARALRRLGILAEEYVDAGTAWLSITAYGRDCEFAGFGDDVAVGAGFWLRQEDLLLPCGDALADPLTGAVAAAEAGRLLLQDHAILLDVSMHHVAAEAARGEVEPHEVRRRSGGWHVESESGAFPVRPPRARAAPGAAPPPGAHTGEVCG
jgi:hypothetical protein